MEQSITGTAPASPRDRDADRDLIARLDRVVERALDDRRIVGTVVLVAKGGDLLYDRAAGSADREAGRAMHERDIFLLASVAKPIVTAAALRLVEDGRISLGASVRRWLPDFAPRLADGRVPDITIRHLLTHTAGLTYVFMEPADGPYHRLRISNGFDRSDADLDEIVRRIAAAPLGYQPGAAGATPWRWTCSARCSRRRPGNRCRRSSPNWCSIRSGCATRASRSWIPVGW
jgi:CubicO group peptidase (beta-lactamase class C family)